MANRRLIILRHGEAEQGAGIDDFDRPLTARGESDAGLVGKWLGTKALLPDRILSSPAARAVATAELAAAACGVEPDIIRLDRRMYLASIADLIAIVETSPVKSQCLMIAGHNPGLETLLDSLVGLYPGGVGRNLGLRARLLPNARRLPPRGAGHALGLLVGGLGHLRGALHGAPCTGAFGVFELGGVCLGVCGALGGLLRLALSMRWIFFSVSSVRMLASF